MCIFLNNMQPLFFCVLTFVLALAQYQRCLLRPHLPAGCFFTKYFVLSKIYFDEGVVKYLYDGFSACTGGNPLAKARGLSPRTGGQTMVHV